MSEPGAAAAAEWVKVDVEPIQEHGMKPHYRCNMAECRKELRDRGMAVNTKITLAELRVMLREARQQAGLLNERGPGEGEMNKIKYGKLAHLKNMARAKNLIFNEAKATVGELRMQLRVHLVRTGSEETILNIGKHAGKTFREILELHPSYAEWAQKEVDQSDDPDWRLAQFAYWCRHHDAMPDASTMVPQDITKKLLEGDMGKIKELGVASTPPPHGRGYGPSSPTPSLLSSQTDNTPEKKKIEELAKENSELKEQLRTVMERLAIVEAQTGKSQRRN